MGVLPHRYEPADFSGAASVRPIKFEHFIRANRAARAAPLRFAGILRVGSASFRPASAFFRLANVIQEGSP